MPKPVVRIEHLTKHYYLESVTVRALRGVSLVVDQGDFVALMGPSGSGKSTLLNLLGCLDRPTDGTYFLGDDDVSSMEDDRLSEIRSKYLGFIFQSYNLLPQYTVVENIEVPLLYQDSRINEATRRRCIQLAELVGLGDRLDHRPMQLSGGQQQRVAIARALVNDPHVILADEPTGNLDSETGADVIDLLAGLATSHGATVVVATHDAELAARAPRRLAMRDGRFTGDPADGAAVLSRV